MKFKELLRDKYVYLLFYLVAIIAIGLLKGIDVAIFLTFFLLLFALVSYSAIGIYNTVKGTKDKWLVWKGISTMVVGAIVYFVYGKTALLTTISYALVLTVIILLYIILYLNRK